MLQPATHEPRVYRFPLIVASIFGFNLVWVAPLNPVVTR
jgi:hypothetical protein